LMAALEEQPKPAEQAKPKQVKAVNARADIEDALAFFEQKTPSTPKVTSENVVVAQKAPKKVTPLPTPVPAPVQVARSTRVARDDINELLDLLDHSSPTPEKSVPAPTVAQSKPVIVKPQQKDNISEEIMALLAENERETALARKIAAFGKKVANFGRSVFNFSNCATMLGTMCGLTVALKRPQNHPTHKPAKPLKQAIVNTKPKQTRKKEAYGVIAKEARFMISERIWGIKAVSEIREKRAILTREMARARRANDLEKMEEIKKQRQELTAKRKIACQRIAGKQMAEIKEKRRLLTKQMTLARRRKDTETMAKITEQRQILKDEAKTMTNYIRGTDYKIYRRAFLKPVILASIQARKVERQHVA